jgi:predicted Zn-dependent protease
MARLRSLSRSAAARALQLDADNVQARAALLLLEPFFGNWLEIEQGLRALLTRHPDNSLVEFNLGFTLAEVGRWEDAIPYLQRVSERERFWPIAHFEHMRARYAAGQVQEAEDLVDEGMRRFPRRREYWHTRMRHLILAGRIPEAIAFGSDLQQRPTEFVDPVVDNEILVARALASRSADARRAALERIQQMLRSVPAFLELNATSTVVLGFVDEALAMLEGYYFGRGQWASAHVDRRRTGFLFSAATGRLRRDGRFARLVQETGLTDYWHKTRTLPDHLRRS